MVVIPESSLAQVVSMLEEQGTLADYEIAIVPDDRYEEVAAEMTEKLKDTAHVKEQTITGRDTIIEEIT